MRHFIHQLATWTRDPGLSRAIHALKSLGGVGLAYLIINSLGLGRMIFGLLAAALLAQCTVGNSPKARKLSMAIAGFGGGVLALIGALASEHHPYAGYIWIVVVTMSAFLSAKLGGRWLVMPRFVMVLVIFITTIPIAYDEFVGSALSYLIGFASAFVVYFYLLPDHKVPLLQSTLHLTFGRLADLIETQGPRPKMLEATRTASDTLDDAYLAMEEARNAHWNQGELVDATSELVLILRELYTDGRFMQRALAALRTKASLILVQAQPLFFAIGKEAVRGLRAAGVAVNVASHRSTLPVYDAVQNIRATLQDLVGSFEETTVTSRAVPTLIRASNFVAVGQNFCTQLERAAGLIDRLHHPDMQRRPGK